MFTGSAIYYIKDKSKLNHFGEYDVHLLAYVTVTTFQIGRFELLESSINIFIFITAAKRKDIPKWMMILLCVIHNALKRKNNIDLKKLKSQLPSQFNIDLSYI